MKSDLTERLLPENLPPRGRQAGKHLELQDNFIRKHSSRDAIFSTPKMPELTSEMIILGGPISILRYYRRYTPYRAILFSGRLLLPQNGAIPSLVLCFRQARPCDSKVSRDNCAIPTKNEHEKVLRYYRYKYRAGPLSYHIT